MNKTDDLRSVFEDKLDNYFNGNILNAVKGRVGRTAPKEQWIVCELKNVNQNKYLVDEEGDFTRNEQGK